MNYRQSHTATVGRDYDAALGADDFNGYMALREAAVLAALLAGPLLANRRRYLDFACGTGRILGQLAPHFEEAVGVDVSEKMVEQARAKAPQATIHLADLTKDTLSLGEFDLVTAFRFFGNAEDALRAEVLRALRARLRPDGVLIINNHRNPAAWRARLSGAGPMDLTLPKLTRLLDQAGFRIVETIPIGSWMLTHRLSAARYWDTRWGALADRVTAQSWLARFSPDMIVIARPARPR